MAEARAQGSPVTGREGFHRGYGQSPAVQSGLLRTPIAAEMRASVAGLTPGQAVTVPDRWLRAAARSVTPPLA